MTRRSSPDPTCRYTCKCGRKFGHWGQAVAQCDWCFMRFLKAWGMAR